MRFAHARHYNSPFSAHDFFMDQLKWATNNQSYTSNYQSFPME